MWIRQLALWGCIMLLSYAEAVFAADRFVSYDRGNDLNGLNDCLERARPCKTIGQALERARAGDTIRVLAGTAPSPECGLIVNKQLQIISEGGRARIEPDAPLDASEEEKKDKVCQGGGFVFKFVNNKKGQPSSLEGFIIKARIKETKGEKGAAVLIIQDSQDVTIKDNSIEVVKEASEVAEAGVGLLILNSSSNRIERNEIRGTRTETLKNEEGIRLEQRGIIPVEDNLFTNNNIHSHGGSGIKVLDALATPTRPNRFLGNQIRGNGGGIEVLNSAGLSFGGAKPEEQNKIVENEGTGLSFLSPCKYPKEDGGTEERACTNIEIRNNVIRQNKQGILFDGPPGTGASFQGVDISNNTIQSNQTDGLTFGAGVYKASIKSNTIEFNGTSKEETRGGIVVEELRAGSDLDLSLNTVNLQRNGPGISIKVTNVTGEVAKLEVIRNVIMSSEGSGIVINLEDAKGFKISISGNTSNRNKASGIEVSGSAPDDKNRYPITANVTEDNGKEGLHIRGSYYELAKNVSQRNLVGLKLSSEEKTIDGKVEDPTRNNEVRENTLSDNRCTGLEISGGQGNKIERNTLLRNGLSCTEKGFGEGIAAGILLHGSSNGNTFRFNTIADNLNGLSLMQLLKDTTGNTFRCNIITHNVRGIQVLPDSAQVPIKDKFNWNNIMNNLEFGLRNFSAVAVLDAKQNWWGDKSGPRHETNPTGKGDRILGPANFSDWRDKLVDINGCS